MSKITLSTDDNLLPTTHKKHILLREEEVSILFESHLNKY